jgi:hypothetical protein
MTAPHSGSAAIMILNRFPLYVGQELFGSRQIGSRLNDREQGLSGQQLSPIGATLGKGLHISFNHSAAQMTTV